MESMASREDGLASLCTGYSQILTHAGDTASPSGSLIQSPMVWPSLPTELRVDSQDNNSKSLLMSPVQIKLIPAPSGGLLEV